MESVKRLLRSDEKLAEWQQRHSSEAGPGAGTGTGLPSAQELPEVLLDLAVPYEDVNELVAAQAEVTSDPVAEQLLELSARTVVRGIGRVGGTVELPPLPDSLGAFGRCFQVLTLVAALPCIRAYHETRGIPRDVSRRTLADLGRNMTLHRHRHGTTGLLVPDWLNLHFRGELYQLGRLQFQRTRLGDRTGALVAAARRPLETGDPVLALHVPDFAGPLTPSACDQSLTRAREFFPRHFPEERCTVATCHSWLLDPQLRQYLPSGSNILRFQDRFRPGHEQKEPDDAAPLHFVFGDPHHPIGTLPRRTTLERSIADHLAAGRHWHVGSGWFDL